VRQHSQTSWNVVSPVAVSVVSLKVPFGLYVIVAVTLIEEYRSRPWPRTRAWAAVLLKPWMYFILFITVRFFVYVIPSFRTERYRDSGPGGWLEVPISWSLDYLIWCDVNIVVIFMSCMRCGSRERILGQLCFLPSAVTFPKFLPTPALWRSDQSLIPLKLLPHCIFYLNRSTQYIMNRQFVVHM